MKELFCLLLFATTALSSDDIHTTEGNNNHIKLEIKDYTIRLNKIDEKKNDDEESVKLSPIFNKQFSSIPLVESFIYKLEKTHSSVEMLEEVISNVISKPLEILFGINDYERIISELSEETLKYYDSIDSSQNIEVFLKEDYYKKFLTKYHFTQELIHELNKKFWPNSNKTKFEKIVKVYKLDRKENFVTCLSKLTQIFSNKCFYFSQDLTHFGFSVSNIVEKSKKNIEEIFNLYITDKEFKWIRAQVNSLFCHLSTENVDNFFCLLHSLTQNGVYFDKILENNLSKVFKNHKGHNHIYFEKLIELTETHKRDYASKYSNLLNVSFKAFPKPSFEAEKLWLFVSVHYPKYTDKFAKNPLDLIDRDDYKNNLH